MTFFGFGKLGQFSKVLFKLSKEGLCIIASLVVTIEHVHVSHVVRIVTGKNIYSKNSCAEVGPVLWVELHCHHYMEWSWTLREPQSI